MCKKLLSVVVVLLSGVWASAQQPQPGIAVLSSNPKSVGSAIVVPNIGVPPEPGAINGTATPGPGNYQPGGPYPMGPYPMGAGPMGPGPMGPGMGMLYGPPPGPGSGAGPVPINGPSSVPVPNGAYPAGFESGF